MSLNFRHGALGRALQLAGLIILPVALWYGLSGGDTYDELLLLALGTALFMMGRGMTAPPGA